MDLKTYLIDAPRGERARLAAAIESEVEYIYQLSGGHSIPSLALAKKIEAETGGKVTVHDWPQKRARQARAGQAAA